MKVETTIPLEFGKGRVPVALYIQIEERLNAQWATQRKKTAVLEKHININREKREDTQ